MDGLSAQSLRCKSLPEVRQAIRPLVFLLPARRLLTSVGPAPRTAGSVRERQVPTQVPRTSISESQSHAPLFIRPIMIYTREIMQVKPLGLFFAAPGSHTCGWHICPRGQRGRRSLVLLELGLEIWEPNCFRCTFQCWVEFTAMAICAWAFLCGEGFFFFPYSISLLAIGLCKLSIPFIYLIF